MQKITIANVNHYHLRNGLLFSIYDYDNFRDGIITDITGKELSRVREWHSVLFWKPWKYTDEEFLQMALAKLKDR